MSNTSTIPQERPVEPKPQNDAPESASKGPAPIPQSGFNGTPQQAPAPTASLYIGDLDPSVTEAMLFELFNMVGPVSSIRVCRDAVSRKSLGYAYVNYMNMVDGEKALENLNYTLIKGKPCRIMWSQRDPASRKVGSGNIFIKNLDSSIDHKALHDTFSAFGNILSCKVAMENGESKGYGFVHFELAESAESAIKNVNGMMLNDQVVFVAHHLSKKERISKADEVKNTFTNVFVKNLELSVTVEDLEILFKPFGTITSATISSDEAGKSKGFGFINFENHDSAQKAIDELNEKEINGTAIYVGRAQKKTEREEELRKQFEEMKLEKINKYINTNLYVKNLDDQVIDTDEKLLEHFKPFGSIASCKIMFDDKGISKGFGFVCFENNEDANKAVAEMNGKMIGTKPLYVAVAQRKEDRRSQLEAMATQRMPPRMPPGPHGMQVPFGYNPMMFQNPYMNQSGRMPMQGFPGPMSMMGQRPRFAPGQNHPGMMQNPNMTRPSFGARPQQPDLKAILSSLPEEQRKQHLGERLYSQIAPRYPKHAPKVTGMLLEMHLDQLVPLLENPRLLDEKVKEAVEILGPME